MTFQLEHLATLITALAALLAVIYQGSKTRAENLKTRAEVAKILHEVNPNGGASMRDAVTRMEARLGDLRTSIGGIRDDARQDRANAAQDRRDLADLRADANVAHQEIKDRITKIEETLNNG